MTTCLDCHGEKFISAIVCPYPLRTQVKCFTCSGTGEITEEHKRKIIEGRTMRDARRARGQSPSERAAELGMDIVAYSHLEHGRL